MGEVRAEKKYQTNTITTRIKEKKLKKLTLSANQC